MIDLSMDEVAQGLHIALGAIGVLLPVAKHWPYGQLWGSIAIAIFAAIKEFWYDERYEDPQTRGNSWEDFAYYLFGILLANIVLWI